MNDLMVSVVRALPVLAGAWVALEHRDQPLGFDALPRAIGGGLLFPFAGMLAVAFFASVVTLMRGEDPATVRALLMKEEGLLWGCVLALLLMAGLGFHWRNEREDDLLRCIHKTVKSPPPRDVLARDALSVTDWCLDEVSGRHESAGYDPSY